VISSLGTQMTWLALPWFVLRTTGSPQRMSWVLIAELVPIAITGFWGGTISARLGARRTMLICDGMRAPLFAAIPFLHARGMLPFPVLIAIVAASGIFLAPYLGVQRSAVPEIVGENQENVATAAALTQAANRVTIFLGPTLAGVLIALISAPNVLYIDAATYIASFVLVALFVHIGPVEAPEQPHGVLVGLRFMMRDRLLRIWQPSFTILDSCWTVFFASLPVLVVTQYHADPHIVGVLIGAFGVGAVAGAVAALFIVNRFDPLVLGSVAFLLQMTCLWGTIIPGSWWVPAGAITASSFFVSLVNSPFHALVTLRIPRDIRTQAMAAFSVVQGIGSPLGLAIGGWALAHFATRHVLVGVLALQTVMVVAIVLAASAERSALRVAALDSPA
jgi:predicted MFS family arabinose efflux permease